VKLTEDYYVMDPAKAVELVDENTICVAAILGSTLNGEFEDVKLLNDLLLEKNKITGYLSVLDHNPKHSSLISLNYLIYIYIYIDTHKQCISFICIE
jgi:glutamate/tyrosine decarboxylase-like PLP-dependent enzyme